MSKLLGNRVYLELPNKEESKIVVDENTKEALQKELMKKMGKLKVVAIGSSITEPGLIIGSEVLVDPAALRDKALVIPKKTGDVLLVSIFDIVEIL
jgi:hypothetical protein